MLRNTLSLTSDSQETKDNTFIEWATHLHENLSAIKTDHNDLQTHIKNLQATLQTVISHQHIYQKTQASYQKQLTTLRTQIACAKENEIDPLANQIKKLERDLANIKAPTVSSLITSQLTTLQEDYLLLKTSSEQLAKLNMTLRTQLQTVIADSERQAAQCATWQKEFTQHAKAQEEAITELQAQLAHAKRALSKRVADVEKRVSGLESWLAQLQQQLTELKPDNDDIKDKLITLQHTLEKSLKEQAAQHHQQVSYQKQMTLLRSQIENAMDKEEVNALTDALKKLERELTTLKTTTANVSTIHTQLKNLQDEYLSIKKSAEQVAKIKQTFRTELQSVIAESERQAGQFSAWQNEFTEQLEKQHKTHEAAISELQMQLSQTKSALTKRLAALEGRVSDVEKKIDKLDPKFTVAQKILKLRTAILEDKFITDELKYYVEPNGEARQDSEDHSPLYDWVTENFLEEKAISRVLLLQGVAGAGKSTFNRFLLKNLWQHDDWKTFQPGQKAPRAYVPIFIPLGSQQINPRQLLKYLTDLPELKQDFTDAEINVLKKDYRLLLIADGYDEMPGHQAINLYDANQLDQYEGRIKLLIGCRTQRVQELNETELFTPHSGTGKPHYDYFKSRHISPFNEHQIHDYLTKYLAQNKARRDITLWKDPETYQQHLNNLPDLKALITTPFLLLMSIEVLPKIVSDVEKEIKATAGHIFEHKNELKIDSSLRKDSGSKFQDMTRAKLYDVLMENWFERQAEKARIAGDTTQPKILIQDYRQFCLKLAECLHQAGVTSVQYPYRAKNLFADTDEEVIDPKGPRGPWVKKLFGTENEAMLRARTGAPLLIGTGNVYQFIHASLIDYFLTTAVTDQLIKPITPPTQIKPIETKTDDTVLRDAVSSSVEVLLSQSLLTRDQIKLFADRIEQENELKENLLNIIKRSKKDPKLAIAAANAITALNAASISLSNYDFRGIRIPGADLSGALLYGTDFQEADLTNVNFQGAYLIQARLQKATLTGIGFGEQAYIKAKGDVIACQYSPDGHWLAIVSGGYDRVYEEKEIALYEATTHRLVRTFVGHTDYVTSVTWSPQGKQLASGSNDKTVRVWKVSTGKELRCLQGHTSYVNSVTWSPQGTHLASGSLDNTVRVWELSTGKALRCWQESHKPSMDSVTCVAWSPQGTCLAFGTRNNKTVRVWEVSTGKELRCFQGHTADVKSVAWSPQGVHLASGSWDQTVRVWEIFTGKELRCLQGHRDGVSSVTWSPQGAYLASGSEDQTVRIWEISTGQELRCLQGHTRGVSSLTWSPQGTRLASGSWDQTIRVWEISAGKALRCLQGHIDEVSSVIWSPHGMYLASGSMDKTVRVSEISTGKALRCFKGDAEYVSSVAWSPKGTHLASGSYDKTVRVWEMSTGKELRCLQGHTSYVNSVTWSPQGAHLASGSSGKTVRVWELSTGKALQCLKGHTGSVTSVTWSPQGTHLASGSYDKTVRVWEISTGRALLCLKGHTGSVTSVAWSLQGRHLASGSADRTIRVWEVSTGKALRCLQGHTHWVTSVSWSPQGVHLASGSWDKTVRVWDVSTGKELLQLLLPEAVESVALQATSGATGETLAVASGRAIACFDLTLTGDRCTSHLKWLAADGTQLHLTGLDVADAKELSQHNFDLLKQRGAIGTPADIKSLEVKETKADHTPGDSKSETELTGLKGLAGSSRRFGTFATSPASPAKASTQTSIQESKVTGQSRKF